MKTIKATDNLKYMIPFDMKETLHPIVAELHILFKHTVCKNWSMKQVST